MFPALTTSTTAALSARVRVAWGETVEVTVPSPGASAVGSAVPVAVAEGSTVAVTGRKVGVTVGKTSLVGVGVAVGGVSTASDVGVELGLGVTINVGVEVGLGVTVHVAVEAGVGVEIGEAGVLLSGTAVSSTNLTRVEVGGMGVGVGVAWGVTGVGAEVTVVAGKKA